VHYGFCGGKVQHVLQADGMCYSFACPLCQHDAIVLHSSSMVNMLSVLFVDDNAVRPVKTVTDKAYGRTRHFRPLHAELELRLMNAADRAATIEEDQKNKWPRMAVEVLLCIESCSRVGQIGRIFNVCGTCRRHFITCSVVHNGMVIPVMKY
jgi:hypothetical protein